MYTNDIAFYTGIVSTQSPHLKDEREDRWVSATVKF